MNNIESTNTIYENPDKKELVKDIGIAHNAANIEAGDSDFHSKSGRNAALEYLDYEEKHANLGGEKNLEGEQVKNNEVFGQLFESVPLFKEIVKVDSNGDRYVTLANASKISFPGMGEHTVVTGVLLHSRYGPLRIESTLSSSRADDAIQFYENLDLNDNVANTLSKKYQDQGEHTLASSVFKLPEGVFMKLSNLDYNNSRDAEVISSAIKYTASDIEKRKVKQNPPNGDAKSAVASILAGLN